MIRKRILYLDIIKCLAFLMVIFNHCDDILFGKSITLFHIHNIMFYFCKAAVPLFFMVSGALLMKRVDSFKKIVKRIGRLLIPLIIITILWSQFKSGTIDIKKMINPENDAYFAYWLWFLIPMIIVYALLPFIRKYTLKYENNKYFKWIIIFLTMLSSIIFTILDFKYKINFLFLLNLFPLPYLYFVLGYLLSKEKYNLKKIIILFILIILNVAIPSLIAYYCKINNISYYFLDDYRNIFSFTIAISIFIIIKYLFGDVKKRNEFTLLINHLSDNSYLIYLFHVFVIEYIKVTPFMKELIAFNKLEAVFVLIAIVVIIIDIPAYILKNIPIINKIL